MFLVPVVLVRNFFLVLTSHLLMMLNNKNQYIVSLVSSLIGVFLLLTEDFGAWQDRDPFYGVREGFVYIGSQKAFPWAQIGILSLSVCLLFLAYTSYIGYSRSDANSENIRLGYLVSKCMVVISVFFGAVFVLLVWDSNWWWFDTGFYAAIISGGINFWIYRQLYQAHLKLS